jgi:arylsulfatase A-like enzyme
MIEWHEEYLSGEPAWELYDIDADPGELKNLSEELPEILGELRQDLQDWKNEVAAQMPALKQTGMGKGQ